MSIKGDDGYRLSLDGKRIIEDWTVHAPRARGAVTTLEAGRSYDVVLEYFEEGGRAELHISYAFVENGSADAVKAAREANAAIFVAGVDALAADEEKDFPPLALPEDQSKLFEAVLAANPRTLCYAAFQCGISPIGIWSAERHSRPSHDCALWWCRQNALAPSLGSPCAFRMTTRRGIDFCTTAGLG